MQTLALIAKIASLPKTHKVCVVQGDGTVHEHLTHSQASAENYATHMRFRFGETARIEVIRL